MQKDSTKNAALVAAEIFFMLRRRKGFNFQQLEASSVIMSHFKHAGKFKCSKKVFLLFCFFLVSFWGRFVEMYTKKWIQKQDLSSS